jgi:hypothetical protein
VRPAMENPGGSFRSFTSDKAIVDMDLSSI